MPRIGTPLSPSAIRVLLCGSGELGKEVVIELQRFGVEVIAVDRYADAPAMQVAHRSRVIDMLDGAALREAEEEIGLPPGLVEVIGPLSPVVSRYGICVTPYVALIPDYVEYRPNDAEIASVFSVPLDFLRQDPRETTHRIDHQGRSWYVPCYRYGSYKIWGLTAIMVVELVNLLFDAGIEMQHPSPTFIPLS